MKEHRVKQGTESQVKVFIPMYEPLGVTKCGKCGNIIAELKRKIRMQKGVHMGVTGRSFRSGVIAAILSLTIATIVFVASGVPIQVEETPMRPVFLLIGASFTAFCSATISVYFTLREIGEHR